MHNNYYFLRQLTQSLEGTLTHSVLMESFSQNKNELILGFSKGKEDFYIKAYLDPAFCCLSFPDDFSRARKNSVDLFHNIISLPVKKIKQFVNERCFALIFNNHYQLLFKMHGNRSNVILFKNNEVHEVFKKGLKNDFNLKINTLDRQIDQSFTAFKNHNGNYSTLFPTFGGLIKDYLHSHDYGAKSYDEKWKLLQNTLHKLSKPHYHLIEFNNKTHLSLLKTGRILKEFYNPISAINHFFITYISNESLRQKKKNVLTELNKKLKQARNYIYKAECKLGEIKEQLDYHKLADIIMANLHQIPPGTTEVVLDNFYDSNNKISVKLKRDLSPQKNAENYYRKAKNQAIEINSLEVNLKKKKGQLAKLNSQIPAIEEASDLRSLVKIIQSNNISGFEKKKQNTSARPFNTFSYQQFDIWVGKNAKSNDLMLQKFSFKDDLWLHAKDVNGSHVLIKYQPGKNFSNGVKEKAAQLAAYYSKGKNDTLCPVIATPRKFIRKRKGDPAGAVVVDKEEEILLVKPEKWT